ncbi:MAG: serine/threonine protein kinase [Nocardiaceae bacterium]|nr:serine/threonine protein kinase [Nocardiaceae bacterium]
MEGPNSELLPGNVLGGYQILRTLGQGGMAKVYLVQHPRLPRQYALKVLSPHLADDPNFRARFEREAHLAAQLDHPNVVAVHDRGIDHGLMWLAMQYVDGTDASALLQTHPNGLDPMRALSILTQAAAGLDAAHHQGMLHRDVKPSNLLLTRDGRVLVADFGIARAIDDATDLTATGNMVATIAYAAPEVISGERADHRSDVYSLGCTFFELLTGSKVFPRPTQVATMDAHLHATPPPPTQMRPGLPHALDAVIATALRKDPNQRFQSCRQLAEAATAALSTTSTRVLATPALTPRPMPRRKKSKRWPVAAAVVILAAAVGVGAWKFWPDNQTTLAGRWIGTVVGDTSGRLVADITDAGNLSARVDYPDIDCAAEWKETGTENGIHHLVESVTSGTCPSSEVTLRRDTDGSLRFTSTYYSASQGQNVEITATLSRDIDLGLDVPISVPPCDGTGIVMLGASITPGKYKDEIGEFLDKHPGSSYLRTDESCPSLRQSTPDGKAIYAVYRPAGKTTGEVCEAVHAAGGDAYGTWLDKTSDPSKIIHCPAG